MPGDLRTRITFLSSKPVDGKWPMDVSIDGHETKVHVEVRADDRPFEEFLKIYVMPAEELIRNYG